MQAALQQQLAMVASRIHSASSKALAAAAARGKRDMALRARRLALGLSLNHDRERLMSYAEELEGEAQTLEREAGATGHLTPVLPR